MGTETSFFMVKKEERKETLKVSCNSSLASSISRALKDYPFPSDINQANIDDLLNNH